ncbi:MAG TPA: hypothetical protein VJX23_03385 [Candidatus Binataceae bacterium]|nr:hypothetical protein [Candidatus Binataceae bacterium]
MNPTLEKIQAAGAPFGLNLVAAVPVARYDAAVTEPYRAAPLDSGAKSIIVIANGGGALWAALKNHADRNPGWWNREHPLDDFTCTIVENELVPAARGAGSRCAVVYPFMQGKSTLNFVELGKAAALAGPSILGVLVHPRFGPWIAFRAAILVDDLIDAPGEARGFDPCPTCVPRSCIAACPTGAVAFPSGWDIPRCLTYRIESEPDCASRCHARAACVIGPEHRYPDDELAHHQKRALRAMRPWYEQNIKRARQSDSKP